MEIQLTFKCCKTIEKASDQIIKICPWLCIRYKKDLVSYKVGSYAEDYIHGLMRIKIYLA